MGSNICSVDGCNEKVLCKDTYVKHYNQIRTYGEIRKRDRTTPNDYIIEGSICKIGVYNRKHQLINYGIINTINIEKCKPHKFGFGDYIACRKSGQYLHHIILGTQPSKEIRVDHINRNVWDNREENLRICNISENACNTGLMSRNASGYKGVSWCKSRNCWAAYIHKSGTGHFLGYFATAWEAALAWNKAALLYHEGFSYQNRRLLKVGPNHD